MKLQTKGYSLESNLIIQEIDNEIIILNTSQEAVSVISKTCHEFLKLIEENKTVEEITNFFLNKYEVESSVLIEDLSILLEDLKQNKILTSK